MAELKNTQTVKQVIPRKLNDQSVELWTTYDVKQWLQEKNLQNFCPLVEKHNITGKNLVQLKLDFLNDDGVMVDDKEVFLSEVYSLVNPACSGVASDEQELLSSWEREKYLAAVQIVHVRRARSQSSSVLLCSELNSKQRCCFLYDTLKVFLRPQCVHCVELNRSDTGFGFTCSVLNHGLVTVQSVSKSADMKSGDVILEMNGILLTRGDNSVETVEIMMRNSTCLQLVYLREIKNDIAQITPDNDIHAELYASERKWKQLHTMLEYMVVEPVDTAKLLADIPDEKIWQMKCKYSEQHDLEEMKQTLSDNNSTIRDLQRTLAVKRRELEAVEMERDVALSRLHIAQETKDSCSSAEAYQSLWENFQSDQITKDDVLRSLKELMLDARHHKTYFDHLLSIVSEKAPQLLDEVEANFQCLSINGGLQEEEFC